MVGDIFEQILPLLNVKKDYENQMEKELRRYQDALYFNYKYIWDFSIVIV